MAQSSTFEQSDRNGLSDNDVILDGRNRAILIVESPARAIAAIRIASVLGDHISLQNTDSSAHGPCVYFCRASNRAIGVHSWNIRSIWNGGMACKCWPRSL